MTTENSAAASDTPLTDAETAGSENRAPQFCDEWVRADFALTLERRARLAEDKSERNRILAEGLIIERDELRTHLRLAEADVKRLDWIVSKNKEGKSTGLTIYETERYFGGEILLAWRVSLDGIPLGHGETPRAAIDAAIANTIVN